MPHSQGFSNNVYPESNQTNSNFNNYSFNAHSNIVLPLCQGLPAAPFQVGLPVEMLKAPLPSSNLAICPANHVTKDINYRID